MRGVYCVVELAQSITVCSIATVLFVVDLTRGRSLVLQHASRKVSDSKKGKLRTCISQIIGGHVLPRHFLIEEEAYDPWLCLYAVYRYMLERLM